MGTSSNRRRWTRFLRFPLYGVAVLAALVVVGALFLPDLLESPAVKAEIERRISNAVRGEVTWDKLSLQVLPWPHGSLHNFRVEKPGVGSVSAEAVDAHLRLWPLLRGRAEITSVTIVRPAIRVRIAPGTPVEEARQEAAPTPDVVEAYRSAVGAIVDVVGRFAPDTILAVDGGSVDLQVESVPPIQLSGFALRVHTGSKGVDLEAATSSNYWSWLALSAHVVPGDLSATARLDISDIRLAAWLERYLAQLPLRITVPSSSLRARARTDGRTRIESEVDLRADSTTVARGAESVEIPGVEIRGTVAAGPQDIAVRVDEARIGAGRLTGGTMRYVPKDGSLALDAGFDLDLAQAMNHARRLAAQEAGTVLKWFQSVAGRAEGRLKFESARGGWSAGVDIVKSDSALQIRDFPGPVHLGGGAIEINPRAVNVSRAAVSMPAGQINLSALRYSFKDGSAEGGADFDLGLPESLELVRRALPEEDRGALSAIESAAGRARGSAKFAYTPKDWNAGVEIVKSDAQVQVRNLPGPAGVSSGSLRVTPTAVRIERAALTLLDASATASATIGDFREGGSVRGSIAEGAIGERFLDWVWQVAKAPPHLMLKAPVRIAAPGFAWGPKQALDLQATARFDAGSSVAVDLGWTPATLDVRRAAIKDAGSDAVIALRVAGPSLEGRFSGSLNAASIASMLKRAEVRGGNLSGDFRLTIDRGNPRNSSADGNLKGEALDLAWLTGLPVTINRIDLGVEDNLLRVREATVNWAGQRATLRGDVRRGEGAPVINAQLESPGLVLEKLRVPKGANPDAKPAEPAGEPKPSPATAGKPSRIWPLPVTGRIEFRSEFVQSGRHKVAPVAATLVLEAQRARVDLKQAEWCGISLPLTLEATPQGFSASARISAQKQQLEQTAICLSEANVLITGTYDLKADISTQGRSADLVQNLKGEIRAEVHDGRVMKFALLGNILSMGNVASLMKEGGPRLDENGFPYRDLIVSGSIAEGTFNLQEGAFRSDALGLAADGWVSLTDYSSRLTVLVAPFSRLDELVRKVPLVGYIIGGTFTSVPVGVSGDIRNPLVVPLGPVAVTSNLLGIFERTLKLPAKLVEPEAK